MHMLSTLTCLQYACTSAKIVVCGGRAPDLSGLGAAAPSAPAFPPQLRGGFCTIMYSKVALRGFSQPPRRSIRRSLMAPHLTMPTLGMGILSRILIVKWVCVLRCVTVEVATVSSGWGVV